MRADEFLDALAARDVRFFTGVPCSFFKGVYSALEHTPERYVPAANEGAALAIAVGSLLARRPCAVLLQNSGLGNLVNPLTSLVQPYGVPALLFVSGRGVGVPDEPQHERMGAITQQVLEACGATVWVMEPEPDAFGAQLDAAQRTAGACAFVVRKGTVDAAAVEPPPTERTLSRPRLLEVTAELAPAAAAVLATTGKQSRELFAQGDLPRNFYSMGSMGHVMSIGLGIALADPERPVIVLDGDGSALMHLGGLSTIGAVAPKRFVHVVVDNERYESTGNQRTTSPTTDFAAVALGCGYASAIRVDDEAGYRAALAAALAAVGPALVHAKVNHEVIPDVPRITTRHPAPEIARRFAAFLSGDGEHP